MTGANSSQNLLVDLDTAEYIPPGVITNTMVLVVNEVDANTGNDSGTDGPLHGQRLQVVCHPMHPLRGWHPAVAVRATFLKA